MPYKSIKTSDNFYNLHITNTNKICIQSVLSPYAISTYMQPFQLGPKYPTWHFLSSNTKSAYAYTGESGFAVVAVPEQSHEWEIQQNKINLIKFNKNSDVLLYYENTDSVEDALILKMLDTRNGMCYPLYRQQSPYEIPIDISDDGSLICGLHSFNSKYKIDLFRNNNYICSSPIDDYGSIYLVNNDTELLYMSYENFITYKITSNKLEIINKKPNLYHLNYATKDYSNPQSVIISSDSKVFKYNLVSNSLSEIIDLTSDCSLITNLAMSNNGKYLAITYQKQYFRSYILQIYKMDNMHLVYQQNVDIHQNWEFSNTGDILFSNSGDGAHLSHIQIEFPDYQTIIDWFKASK